MPANRDELRKALLAAKAQKSEVIELFGQQVEIKQPTIREVLDLNVEDNKEAIVRVLINHCYVPGTNEKVFEEGDREDILSWPVGDWLKRVTEAVERLTNVDVGASEKK